MSRAIRVKGSNPMWGQVAGAVSRSFAYIPGFDTPTTDSEAVAAASVSGDNFAVASNAARWATGQPVVLTTTGALPGGLTAGNFVYLIRNSATSVSFAYTYGAAIAGTKITLSGTGSGVHTISYRAFKNFGNVGPVDFGVKESNSMFATPGYIKGDADAGSNPSTSFAWDWRKDTNLQTVMKFMTGATDGIGGRALLVAFEHVTASPIFAGGTNFVTIGNGTIGYKLALSASGVLQWRTFPGTARALTAALTAATRYKFLVHLDAKNGDVQLYADGGAFISGVQVPVTAVATMLPEMDDAVMLGSSPGLLTLAANNNTGSTEPVPSVTMAGTMRNLLLLDSTDMTAAQVARLFEEYKKGPNYCVPRYLASL